MVKKEKVVDWVEVANGMSNGRTVFDCFRNYQEKYSPQIRMNRIVWTAEDNAKIMKLVERYTDKETNEINWTEIRFHFDGQSKTQIYS